MLLAGLLRVDPSFAALMQGQPADSLVPTFLMQYLPAGLRGLLLASLLAAAMSSIDSALNSLAAVTLEDVFDRPPSTQSVWLSRGVSLAWGVFAIAAGFVAARSGTGVLELVNQVGSAFYGPVLAVFVLGAMAPFVRGGSALAGLGAGVATNLMLAWFQRPSCHGSGGIRPASARRQPSLCCFLEVRVGCSYPSGPAPRQ